MRPVIKTFFQPTAVGTVVASLLLLTGCATGRDGQATMALRAEAQQQMARVDSAPAQADSRDTYVQLVAQMQQKGLYFASLAHIEALQQRWGADPESSLLLADALRHTGQTARAEVLYSQLRLGPVKARAEHGLGLLAGRSGHFANAEKHLQSAAAAAPTDANILSDLGFALLQQGRWEEARVPLMKSAELASDNPKVWSNIALFLTLNGQTQQASEVMVSRQLSDTSRTQIIELARSIQQRLAPSARPQPAADAYTNRLVLSPAFGLASLGATQGNALAGSNAEAGLANINTN